MYLNLSNSTLFLGLHIVQYNFNTQNSVHYDPAIDYFYPCLWIIELIHVEFIHELIHYL